MPPLGSPSSNCGRTTRQRPPSGVAWPSDWFHGFRTPTISLVMSDALRWLARRRGSPWPGDRPGGTDPQGQHHVPVSRQPTVVRLSLARCPARDNLREADLHSGQRGQRRRVVCRRANRTRLARDEPCHRAEEIPVPRFVGAGLSQVGERLSRFRVASAV